MFFYGYICIKTHFINGYVKNKCGSFTFWPTRKSIISIMYKEYDFMSDIFKGSRVSVRII